MEKKISFNTRLFVEDIVNEYSLENFLLEGDPEFASCFDKNLPTEERLAVKFMFNKKIKECLEKKVPLSKIIPSGKLINIIADLINQKIDYNDLPQIIKEGLGVSDEIATNIAQEITNNKKINEDRINEFVKEDFEEDEEKEETTEIKEDEIPSPPVPQQKGGGLSQELQ